MGQIHDCNVLLVLKKNVKICHFLYVSHHVFIQVKFVLSLKSKPGLARGSNSQSQGSLLLGREDVVAPKWLSHDML